MADVISSDAVLEVEGAVIDRITNWSMDQTASVVDTSDITDSYNKASVGMRDASGSFDAHFDPDDTTGQGAIEQAYKNGQKVDLTHYPAGNKSGEEKVTYKAVITSIGKSATKGRETVKIKVAWQQGAAPNYETIV